MLALHKALKLTGAQHALRHRTAIESRAEGRVCMHGKIYSDYTSNDYLNLSTHRDVIHAFIEAAKQYGTSSGSAPHISGYSHYHEILEHEYAQWQQRDRALFFNSGYHANLAVYSVLASRQHLIFSDKHAHASILDGVQLSRAKHLRYQHQDLSHLSTLLNQHTNKPKLITTESVFSMDGSITDLQTLAKLVKQHQALLCVDDAHGVGVLGELSRGAVSAAKLNQNDVPCLIQPLGKAMGGMGAMVSGEARLIEALQQYARTYRYSTALPASMAAALLAALKVIKTEPERQQQLQTNIQHFNIEANKRGLTLLCHDNTAIRSILTGSNEATLKIQTQLQERGHFVAAIRPPTVPANTARLRISLCAKHTPADITQLLDDLVLCLAK
ncbi:MAG TPA: 8-amino-7-oxononanoate synthase [Gammaproteobacteria bacterium]|nr:8-amino-7-oxononanoate synthase [Gammaproteobacteria bacterium]